MKLYKFTPTLEIAEKISAGIFRFYELTKYIEIEDEVGRSDSEECSVSFPSEEYEDHPEKLPTGKFNGVEFKAIKLGNNKEYIKQYFVFCMSTKNNKKAIGDSKFYVELYEDNFNLFMMLLNEPYENIKNYDGRKFFSHGAVEYYNIHNHPKPLKDEIWREVYLKHSEFDYQNEYRAAFFAADHFFDRVKNQPMLIEKKIYIKGKEVDFNLELYVNSGVDDDGWRYLEIDISKFAANMSEKPSKIIKVN